MKSLFLHGVNIAMACACLCSHAQAQTNYQNSSLLPLPTNSQRYPISQTSANYNSQIIPQQNNVPAVPERRGVYNATQPVGQYNNSINYPPQQQVISPAQHQHTPGHHHAPGHYHGPQTQISPEPIPDGTMHHAGGGCSTCGGHHLPGQCPMSASQGYPAPSYGASPYMNSPYGGNSYMDGYGSSYGCNSGSWVGNGMNGYGNIGYTMGAQARCGWFGGAGALIMNRDRGNFFAFSVENTATTEHLQLVNNRDVSMNWSGGLEARFGRYFNCGRWAWEGVYWGIYPGQQEYTLLAASLANPGNLDGIHDWSQISMFDPDIGANATVDGWVNSADAHRIRRNFEFHNVELNFWNYSGCMMSGNCGQPISHFNWGFGARFFQFGEDVLFSAKEGGTGTVFDDGTNQVDWYHDINNYLIGFQLSGDGRYYLSSRCALTVGAKLGMYGNHMNYRTSITSGGNTAFVNNGPFNGTAWNLQANKNDFAFLGELNAGVEYQITCRWKATAGYRAVAITGVALVGEQIHPDLRAINDAVDIDSNGSMILHGVSIGAEYNY